MSIAIIGCGFLGSLVAEESAKRLYAFNEKRDYLLLDYDTVEERNAANQNFTLDHAGELKVDALAHTVGAYHRGDIIRKPYFLDRSNYMEHLQDVELAVSALDNMEARNLLWYWAKQAKRPVLHLGISQGGIGAVEWTFRGHDSWTLSPLNIIGNRRYAPKKEEQNDNPEAGVQKLPPCELVSFRGLGLNTALAGAKALGIFLGFDPERHVSAETGEAVVAETITTWNSDLMSHSLRAVDTSEVGHE